MSARRTRSVSAVAATALALTLGLPVAATAAPPDSRERTDFSYDLPALVDCGDVALDVHVEGWNRVATRGDTFRLHVSWVLTWTNPQTGASLSSSGNGNAIVDEAADTYEGAGKYRVVTVPGEGVVLHSTGRLLSVFSTDEVVFDAGPTEEDETLLCAHLT